MEIIRVGILLLLFHSALFSARGENFLSRNIFLSNNDFLFARGNDGLFRPLFIQADGNLLYGNFPVPENHSIVLEVGGIYCTNLGRVLSSLDRVKLLSKILKNNPNEASLANCRAAFDQRLALLSNTDFRRQAQNLMTVAPGTTPPPTSGTTTVSAPLERTANIFRSNDDFLMTRGTDGRFRPLLFDQEGNLSYNNVRVLESHPILNEVGTLYCQNLDRPLANVERTKLLKKILDRNPNDPALQRCRSAFTQKLSQLSDRNLKGVLEAAFSGEPPKAVTPPSKETTVPRSVASGTPNETKPNPTKPLPHDGADKTPQKPSERPIAEEPSNAFCSEPERVICQEAEKVEQEQGDMTARRAAVFKEAVTLGGANFTAVSGSELNADWERYFVGLQELTGAQTKQFLDSVPAWKESFKSTLAADASISDADKKRMYTLINQIPVFNLLNEVRDHKITLAEFLAHCGSDGLSTGGYNQRTKGIYFCPAKFSTLQEHSAFARTLLHELGHSVDADVFPDAYTAQESCWQHTDFTNYNKGSHVAERSAEYNAVTTAAASMKQLPKDQVLRSIVGFVGLYCPNVGAGAPAVPPDARTSARSSELFKPDGVAVHFDYHFMLDVLWGRNPTLRTLMGCPAASQVRPYCTRAGRAQ